ncbi:MAG: integrase core domain-containing protein [Chloroflexota bacterium]
MSWFIIAQFFSTLIELVLLRHQTDRAKDLQILLLRRQLAIVERKLDKPLQVSRAEKFVLAVLAVKLKSTTGQTIKQLHDVICIFQPETVFKWHRELVRRKWTYRRRVCSGRPPTDLCLERLVLQLAKENDWGCGKIEGELLKLGYCLSDETIANILKRHGFPLLPQRRPSLGWRHLMTHYKDQILACDFFTIETLLLQTVYVFFFMELGSRRVHFVGCTMHPTGAWVTQQARQFVWQLKERDQPLRFLIRDNDSKFTSSFDAVFASERMRVIHIPIRAPNANAYAERWVRTVREECTDKLLIFNEDHLRRVMRTYVDYYNSARPHQGIEQRCPVPKPSSETEGVVRYHNILGIIHDYYREVA